jgi:HD superfamily phosphodiesterase
LTGRADDGRASADALPFLFSPGTGAPGTDRNQSVQRGSQAKYGLTLPLRARDNAALMAAENQSYESIVESRFPGLVARIRGFIENSEREYEGDAERRESHLWEHTVQVASLACRLATLEGLDPLIPSIAALFHDAGKFAGGRYHEGETAEEEESARIAARLLGEAGMKAADIRKVTAGLVALYNEKAGENAVAALIHDADFLSKFGALGIAAFFTKSVLRGRTLRSSVLGYLSKELTYAASLPANMRTAAGRRMAEKKAGDSLRFFRNLLAELKDAGIVDLRIRRLEVPSPRGGKALRIRLAAAPACPSCGGRWRMAWRTEQGVKCTSLHVEWDCARCDERLETSFCLPEIA